MTHTIKVIAGGLVLLALCLLIGRWVGGATPGMGLVRVVKVFVRSGSSPQASICG